MKKNLLILGIALCTVSSFAQTNLITNGSFEDPNSPWTGWTSTVANGNLWAGQGTCGGSVGTDYAWSGDQNEATGIDDLEENMLQQVTIPGNANAVTLFFDASVNTLETTTTTSYDQLEINILNTSGTLLESLGYIDNTNGDYGLGSCQTWAGFYVNIPNTYWGQTIRVEFAYSTDVSNPTIFRIDEVELLYTTPSTCTYSLSNTTYGLNDALAGSASGVASVNTQASCTWDATVVTGATWLTTTSGGTGSGDIDISFTANPTQNIRTGTIEIDGGSVLTVTQPGKICTYALSTNTYNCPNHVGDDLNNIALVSTDNDCSWSADVVSGGSWLLCTSDGTGNDKIDISVTTNTTDSARVGTIVVESETLMVIQPVDFELTGIAESAGKTMSVYPNPSNGVTVLNVHESFVGSQFTIIDRIGRTVQTGTISTTSQSIDMQGLASGTYIINVNGDDSILSEKIIKI